MMERLAPHAGHRSAVVRRTLPRIALTASVAISLGLLWVFVLALLLVISLEQLLASPTLEAVGWPVKYVLIPATVAALGLLSILRAQRGADAGDELPDRTRHAWVWPVEGRLHADGTCEVRLSDPRDLEPYVRRREDDPDRPWQRTPRPDRDGLRAVIEILAPSDVDDAFATACELLRRLESE